MVERVGPQGEDPSSRTSNRPRTLDKSMSDPSTINSQPSTPFAICNETFGDWPWERVCRFVAETGFDGIEIAPFTFAESVEQLSPERRREIATAAKDAGLPVVALHWLLASPK